MFNLTVDEAHTFYVGDRGWLVHNQSSRPNYNVKPTQAGVNTIVKHLSNPFFDPSVANDVMISRIQDSLKSGKYISGADANFYMHELYESTQMRGGAYTRETYDLAHGASLKKYGVSNYAVYGPEAMKAANVASMKEYGAKMFDGKWLTYWDDICP